MGVAETLAAYFNFEHHDTDFRTETIAGATTFLAMAYIIVVNPAILGPAIVGGFTDEGDPIPETTIAGDTYTYGQVLEMLAVATILASIIAILVMAIYAKRPFGLAPGMGLNTFFTFTVVLLLGVPWQVALAAVFVEGVIFIAITAIGAREYVIKLFPKPVKYAVGAGIGVFLLFLGFQEMELIVPYVDGAGFPEQPFLQIGNAVISPVAALSVVGLAFTLMLWARGVRGSILIGIITTAILGYLLTLVGIVERGILEPGILTQVEQEGASSIFLGVQYDFTPLFWGFLDGLGLILEDPLTFVLVVFTFFFVDFFDTAGTLIGVSQIGGFLDADGNLPEMNKPLMADAIGTTAGAMIGTSTVTTYIESATGLEEGGRTGFTALVVGCLFLLSLLVVPLVSAIPVYATHIALVLVGIIMLQGVADIDWNDPVWAISGGLTITVMPLTASIANGLAAGIMSYPLLKAATGNRADVTPGQWTLLIVFTIYFIAYFMARGGLLSF